MSIDLPSCIAKSESASSFNLDAVNTEISAVGEEVSDSGAIVDYDEDQGDTVSISEQALAMAQTSASETNIHSGPTVSAAPSADDSVRDRDSLLQKQINEVKREIQALQQSTELPKDEKQRKVMLKEQQLAELQQQSQHKSAEQILEELHNRRGTRAEWAA